MLYAQEKKGIIANTFLGSTTKMSFAPHVQTGFYYAVIQSGNGYCLSRFSAESLSGAPGRSI